MINTTTYEDKEQIRLADLYSYDILDTESDQEFNDLVELASGIAGTPVSLVTLVDASRQWFKANKGFGASETPREIAFCGHAIETEEENFIIEDSLEDPRFANNPLVVNDPGIRFYAGFPLVTIKGSKIGTLCVIDTKPKSLSTKQVDDLGRLSRQAMRLIELRLLNRKNEELRKKQEAQQEQLQKILDNQRKIITILGHDTRAPLGSMKQILNMMASGSITGADSIKFYGLMDEQIDTTISMIENLILWGEVYLSTEKTLLSAKEIPAICEEIVSTFDSMAKEKQIHVLHEASGEVLLHTNKETFSFILRNLLHNAIKYTEKGSIHISCSALMDHYELYIKDSGKGMNEATKQSLFAGKTSSRVGTKNEKGSGIGLLLINDFIKEMGGSIEIESMPDKGTTVRVLIPFHHDPESN
jgi:signal transduction histidine kinase